MDSYTQSAATTRKCPNCGNHQVYRSQRVSRWDKFLSLFNIYPYRCQYHTCGIRFRRFGKK